MFCLNLILFGRLVSDKLWLKRAFEKNNPKNVHSAIHYPILLQFDRLVHYWPRDYSRAASGGNASLIATFSKWNVHWQCFSYNARKNFHIAMFLFFNFAAILQHQK